MPLGNRRIARNGIAPTTHAQPDASHIFMNHLRRETAHAGNRTPMVKALREMHRMAGKPSFFARLFSGKEEVRIQGTDRLTSQQLKEIEHRMAREGFESTLLHIAAPHPKLTDLLQDPARYKEFVAQIPEKKWQQALTPFAKHPNQQLRAMALLVFLQRGRLKQ